MKLYILSLFIILFGMDTAYTQSSGMVGGACEGCEAIYEFGQKHLTPVDTLPGFKVNNPKLKIQGIVFESDGKTPAKDVILYIYHTNRKGIYETRGDEKGWGRRHGIYRGWIKTNESGEYAFYTFQPAAYPTRTEAAHIHFIVKEPSKNEYYIESIVFKDDPLLSQKDRTNKTPRGGSGVMELTKIGDLNVVERNITLGLNIPNYE